MNFVEKMIVRQIAAGLLARTPYETITVCSERGYDPDAKSFPNVDAKATKATIEAIVEECDQFDEVHIFVGGNHEEGYGPYVYLIFGNGNGGWDVMSDWITSLDDALQPTLEFIEKNGD